MSLNKLNRRDSLKSLAALTAAGTLGAWSELALHGCYIAQHFGRLAQQYAHGHLNTRPHACHCVCCAAPRGG